VLQQAWVATVEVDMATWKAIKAPRPDKDLDICEDFLHTSTTKICTHTKPG
jgi:hypothetical protein